METEYLTANLYGFSPALDPVSVLDLRYPASLNAYLKITGDTILVVGQTNQPSRTKLTAIDPASVALKLGPWTIQRLLGLPASAITNCTVPLCELRKKHQDKKLLEELKRENDVQRKKAVLESFANSGPEHPMARRFLNLVLREPSITVRGLSEKTGVSTRQLQRIMLNTTGFTTKEFLNILRFENSLTALARNATEPDIAALALESGYFDQAHFTRQFKRFSGFTPARYRSEMSDLYNTTGVPDATLTQIKVQGAEDAFRLANIFEKLLV